MSGEDDNSVSSDSCSDDSDDSNIIILPTKKDEPDLDSLDVFFEKYKQELNEDVEMEPSDQNPQDESFKKIELPKKRKPA